MLCAILVAFAHPRRGRLGVKIQIKIKTSPTKHIAQWTRSVLPQSVPHTCSVVDWAMFQSVLDKWWTAYEPPGDLHQQESDMMAAIHRAADAAIPRSSPGRRRCPDWWFYSELREHNHRVNIHRKLYKKRPNRTTLRLLQEVVSRMRVVFQQAKEAKWLQWCATFSQHTSLG